MRSLLAADERAFPAVPPADLDDSEAIVSNDRSAFDRIDWMRDHWDRERWREGYSAYYWMLTFPDAPDLVKLARQCQEQLAPLGMDNVPDNGLHITMLKIGDAAQVDQRQVQHLATAVAGTFPDAFVIQAHPLAASRGAARFTVTPWTPLVRLHQSLTDATAAAGLPGGRPTRRFRPHLGVAYNNRKRRASEVAEYLDPLRELEPVSLPITSIDLVRLRREDSTYRWDVVASVPLSPAHVNDHLL